MKKMLINATQLEETRIAIIQDKKLIDLDIENIDREQKKSNIYKAKISRIEPSLNAVFVNYGENKNGFLPYKEIASSYFKKPQDTQAPLNEQLDNGQELIVQIVKEERGNKGAALTSFITLAGCYMVLMPTTSDAGGISRRIEGKDRDQLKAQFNQLTYPSSMSVIIRTAAIGRTQQELQSDLDALVTLWKAIQSVSKKHPAPFLIHKESDITIRTIRDHLKDDIEQIIVDTKATYQDMKRQLRMLRPAFVERLHLFQDNTPLLSYYDVEKQIESAFHREVKLPSGGSIVIDTTEALTAVDVNSARSTKGDNIEETALQTNLEAAEEISRQLRLRDLGGLVIIDFIDMQPFPNQKTVENQLVESLQQDRAKIQMTRISKFGLVELSRQRLQASLGESVMNTCPSCHGQGFVRPVPSIGLSILRNIREEAGRDKTNEVRVQLSTEVATFLLNEKRQDLARIEQNFNIKVVLVPNPNFPNTKYRTQRIWGEVYHANRPSFDLIEEEKETQLHAHQHKASQQPAIKQMASAEDASKETTNQATTDNPAEKQTTSQPAKHSLLRRFSEYLFNNKPEKTAKKTDQQPKKKQSSDQPADKNAQHSTETKQKPKPQNTPAKTRTPQQSDNKNKPAQESNKTTTKPQSSGQSESQDNKKRHDNHQSKSNHTNHKKSNSRTNSNRLQVHNSQDVIDIAEQKAKQDAQKPKTQHEIFTANNVIKSISTNPEEKISPMVQTVLNDANTLVSESKHQLIETADKTKPRKYLKPVIETVETIKPKRQAQPETKKPNKPASEKKPEKTEKPTSKETKSASSNASDNSAMILPYSPALAYTQQGFKNSSNN